MAPHVKDLNESKKPDCETSLRQIITVAAAVLRSMKTHTTNNRRRSGSPQKNDGINNSLFLQPCIKNRWTSISGLAQGLSVEIGVSLTVQTVWRTLHEVHLYRWHPGIKPLLIKLHKTARYKFAKGTWKEAWWMLAAHSLMRQKQNKLVWIRWGPTCLAWTWPGLPQWLDTADCGTWGMECVDVRLIWCSMSAKSIRQTT